MKYRLIKIILIVFTILIILGIVFGSFAFSAFGNAQMGKDFVSKAEQAATDDRDFGKTVKYLSSSEKYFSKASSRLKVLIPLRIVPWISQQVEGAMLLVDSAAESTKALADIASVANDIYEPFKNNDTLRIRDLKDKDRIAILEAIQESIPAIEKAKNDLKKSEQEIDKVLENNIVPQIKKELIDFNIKLSMINELLADVVPIVEIVPSLLGFPEQKSYLFILQNSDEMRPSGGFIGTYGLVTFKLGGIVDFFTDDVYNLDKTAPADSRPPSPEPIRKYLEQPKLYLRDANWSPDFPTSAESIIDVYYDEAIHRGPEHVAKEISGVIAVMPETIRRLLEFAGPVVINGQIFDADNLTDVLEYEVEIGFEDKGVAKPQRKAIISDLGYGLIRKIMTLPSSKWVDVLHSIKQSFDEKHFVIFTKEKNAQNLIKINGWAGDIKNTQDDYISVIDANLFSLKTDPYVSRHIKYNVEKVGNDLIGEVEIIYSYPETGPAWKTKGYRSYTRVYVPKGSELISYEGALDVETSSKVGEIDISEENGKIVFGAFIVVFAEEEHVLKLKYKLPDNIGKKECYNLYVQKQAGTIGHSLTVSVDFGKVAQLWSPSGLNVNRDNLKLIWQTNLKRDVEFNICF